MTLSLQWHARLCWCCCCSCLILLVATSQCCMMTIGDMLTEVRCTKKKKEFWSDCSDSSRRARYQRLFRSRTTCANGPRTNMKKSNLVCWLFCESKSEPSQLRAINLILDQYRWWIKNWSGESLKQWWLRLTCKQAGTVRGTRTEQVTSRWQDLESTTWTAWRAQEETCHSLTHNCVKKGLVYT